MTEDERIMGGLLADTVAVELPPASVPVASSRTGAAPPARLPRVRADALCGPNLDALERRANGSEKPIPLGLPELAKLLGGGLWPGCHVLTGAPGSGKSQLALQLALEAARSGVPVRYVALELDELGLLTRTLYLTDALDARRMKGGKPLPGWWSEAYTGQASPATVAALRSRVAPMLAGVPLYLDAAKGSGWPYTEIGPALAELRAAEPVAGAAGNPAFLIVDFLQLVGSPNPAKSEELRERIGGAAYQAREATRKDPGATVLLISSAARGAYERLVKEHGDVDPASLLDTGKESGEIEYAADTVLALGRDKGGTPWIAVAKQRTGATGCIPLRVEGGTFGEAAAPQVPKVVPQRASPQTTKGGGDDGNEYF